MSPRIGTIQDDRRLGSCRHSLPDSSPGPLGRIDCFRDREVAVSVLRSRSHDDSRGRQGAEGDRPVRSSGRAHSTCNRSTPPRRAARRRFHHRPDRGSRRQNARLRSLATMSPRTGTFRNDASRCLPTRVDSPTPWLSEVYRQNPNAVSQLREGGIGSIPSRRRRSAEAL